MLSYWQRAAAAVRSASGSGLLRATGEMRSVLNHPDGRREFFRYEARLTGAVASLPAVIFCLYDLQRFGAEVLMDTLRTHPIAVVDGEVSGQTAGPVHRGPHGGGEPPGKRPAPQAGG
jgi:hypothetical protein